MGEILTNNILDTALIFEGGGMRASFSAGIINALLENQLYFNYVAGISAGTSSAVNYLSRDIERTKKSFVDIVKDKNYGGIKTLLTKKGLFNAKYIYQEMGLENGSLPYDWEKFMSNPAELRIGALEADTGKLLYWSRRDITRINDLMVRVRASSSMPLLMPPTRIGSHLYYDGGLGGGIPLDIAETDGYEKFFIVLTRERGYRKSPPKFRKIFRKKYKNYPRMVEAYETRYLKYNKILDKIEELEARGRAFVVYPDKMTVSSTERKLRNLENSYELAYLQANREVDKWREFLGK